MEEDLLRLVLAGGWLCIHPSHVFRTETAQQHASNPTQRQHRKQQCSTFLTWQGVGSTYVKVQPVNTGNIRDMTGRRLSGSLRTGQQHKMEHQRAIHMNRLPSSYEQLILRY